MTYRYLVLATLLLLTDLSQSLPGQSTRISLKNQSRELDYSAASSSRPVPVLSTLPTTCEVGSIVFKADGALGENLYACVATNTWQPQGRTFAPLPNFKTVKLSGTTLSIGADCELIAPCVARVGPVAYRFFAASTLTLGAGSGMAFIYVSKDGQLTVSQGSPGSLAMSCTCQVETTTTGFPYGSIPLWTWNATTNIWNDASTGAIDHRALLSTTRSILGGSNITVAETGSSITINSTNPTLPAGTVVGTGTLRLSNPPAASTTSAVLGLGLTPAHDSAQGAYFSINSHTGFSGLLADWRTDGTSRFQWLPDGTFSASKTGQAVTWWGNRDAQPASSFRLAIGNAQASSFLSLGTGSAGNFLRANGLGKVAIGTSAPTPSSADLLVRDATASTGNTKVEIQAGEGQSTNLLEFQTAAAGLATFVSKEAMLVMRPIGSRPSCIVALRGALWFDARTGSTADGVSVCRRAADGSFAWIDVIP